MAVMPNVKANLPQPGETKAQFITRVIRTLMKAGKSKDAAIQIATRIWNNFAQHSQVTPGQVDANVSFSGSTSSARPSSGGRVTVNNQVKQFAELSNKLDKIKEQNSGSGFPGNLADMMQKSIINGLAPLAKMMSMGEGGVGNNPQFQQIVSSIPDIQSQSNQILGQIVQINAKIYEELSTIRSTGMQIKRVNRGRRAPNRSDYWTSQNALPRMTGKTGTAIENFAGQLVGTLPGAQTLLNIGRIISNPVGSARTFLSNKVRGWSDKIRSIFDVNYQYSKDPDKLKEDAGIKFLKDDELLFKVQTDTIPQALADLKDADTQKIELLGNIYTVSRDQLSFLSKGQVQHKYNALQKEKTVFNRDKGIYQSASEYEKYVKESAATQEAFLDQRRGWFTNTPFSKFITSGMNLLGKIEKNLHGVSSEVSDKELSNSIINHYADRENFALNEERRYDLTARHIAETSSNKFGKYRRAYTYKDKDDNTHVIYLTDEEYDKGIDSEKRDLKNDLGIDKNKLQKSNFTQWEADNNKSPNLLNGGTVANVTESLKNEFTSILSSVFNEISRNAQNDDLKVFGKFNPFEFINKFIPESLQNIQNNGNNNAAKFDLNNKIFKEDSLNKIEFAFKNSMSSALPDTLDKLKFNVYNDIDNPVHVKVINFDEFPKSSQSPYHDGGLVGSKPKFHAGGAITSLFFNAAKDAIKDKVNDVKDKVKGLIKGKPNKDEVDITAQKGEYVLTKGETRGIVGELKNIRVALESQKALSFGSAVKSGGNYTSVGDELTNEKLQRDQENRDNVRIEIRDYVKRIYEFLSENGFGGFGKNQSSSKEFKTEIPKNSPIKDLFTGALGAILGALLGKYLLPKIKELFEDHLPAIFRGFAPKIIESIEKFGKSIKEFPSTIWKHMKELGERISTRFSQFTDSAKDFISKMKKSLSELADDGLKGIKKFGSKVWTGLKDINTKISDLGKSTVSTIAKGAGKILTSPVTLAKGLGKFVWRSKGNIALAGAEIAGSYSLAKINAEKNGTTVEEELDKIYDTFEGKGYLDGKVDAENFNHMSDDIDLSEMTIDVRKKHNGGRVTVPKFHTGGAIHNFTERLPLTTTFQQSTPGIIESQLSPNQSEVPILAQKDEYILTKNETKLISGSLRELNEKFDKNGIVYSTLHDMSSRIAYLADKEQFKTKHDDKDFKENIIEPIKESNGFFNFLSKVFSSVTNKSSDIINNINSKANFGNSLNEINSMFDSGGNSKGDSKIKFDDLLNEINSKVSSKANSKANFGDLLNEINSMFDPGGNISNTSNPGISVPSSNNSSNVSVPSFNSSQLSNLTANSSFKVNNGAKVSDNVKAAIINAAKTTGINPSDLATIINMESGFNPNDQAKKTSAAGLFQFTRDSWRDIQRQNPSYNIPDFDQAKYNPYWNALAGALLVKRNSNALKKQLGRDPTTTELYMSHFLGQAGSSRFASAMAQNRNMLSSSAVGEKSFNANTSIFMTEGGRTRSVGEVYDLLDNRINKKRVTVGDISSSTAINRNEINQSDTFGKDFIQTTNSSNTSSSSSNASSTTVSNGGSSGGGLIQRYMSIARRNAANATRAYGKKAYQMNPNRSKPNMYDCSSFVGRSLKEAGLDVNPLMTTESINKGALNKYFDRKNGTFSTSQGLQVGDILWKPGHVEFYDGNDNVIGAHSGTTGISSYPFKNQIGPKAHGPFKSVFRLKPQYSNIIGGSTIADIPDSSSDSSAPSKSMSKMVGQNPTTQSASPFIKKRSKIDPSQPTNEHNWHKYSPNYTPHHHSPYQVQATPQSPEQETKQANLNHLYNPYLSSDDKTLTDEYLKKNNIPLRPKSDIPLKYALGQNLYDKDKTPTVWQHKLLDGAEFEQAVKEQHPDKNFDPIAIQRGWDQQYAPSRVGLFTSRQSNDHYIARNARARISQQSKIEELNKQAEIATQLKQEQEQSTINNNQSQSVDAPHNDIVSSSSPGTPKAPEVPSMPVQNAQTPMGTKQANLATNQRTNSRQLDYYTDSIVEKICQNQFVAFQQSVNFYAIGNNPMSSMHV